MVQKEAAMSIKLTPQQQQPWTPKKKVRRVSSIPAPTPAISLEVDYESIRELLEDERRQQAIHGVALRNAAGRMNEAP